MSYDVVSLRSAGMLEDKDDPAKGAALFLRENGRLSSYYANRTFAPVFKATPEEIIPSNRSKDIEMAHALCGDSIPCMYDYSVTLNRDVAHYTLNYHATVINLKTIHHRRGKSKEVHSRGSDPDQ